eukprot:1719605-Alexandrium_andersonii.AAC.1
MHSAHSQFLRFCRGLYGSTLSPVTVHLTLYDDGWNKVKKPCSFMFPFDVVANMHKLSPKQFRISMLGGCDA